MKRESFGFFPRTLLVNELKSANLIFSSFWIYGLLKKPNLGFLNFEGENDTSLRLLNFSIFLTRTLFLFLAPPLSVSRKCDFFISFMRSGTMREVFGLTFFTLKELRLFPMPMILKWMLDLSSCLMEDLGFFWVWAEIMVSGVATL